MVADCTRHSNAEQSRRVATRRVRVTYAQFARKLWLSASTLYRLENGEQRVTLQRLEPVLTRLKCRLTDVFPEGI